MGDPTRTAPGSAVWAEWVRYHRRLADRLATLTPEELALRVSPEGWPVWAILAHVSSARVYWLCGVLGEPGLETTPFPDPDGEGWEDQLETPRGADELMEADASTWRIVLACLDRWTPAMLDDGAVRVGRRGPEVHSRRSVIVRLVSHEAFHVGEVTAALAAAGRPPLDLWPASPPPDPPYERPAD